MAITHAASEDIATPCWLSPIFTAASLPPRAFSAASVPAPVAVGPGACSAVMIKSDDPNLLAN